MCVCMCVCAAFVKRPRTDNKPTLTDGPADSAAATAAGTAGTAASLSWHDDTDTWSVQPDAAAAAAAVAAAAAAAGVSEPASGTGGAGYGYSSDEDGAEGRGSAPPEDVRAARAARALKRAKRAEMGLDDDEPAPPPVWSNPKVRLRVCVCVCLHCFVCMFMHPRSRLLRRRDLTRHGDLTQDGVCMCVCVCVCPQSPGGGSSSRALGAMRACSCCGKVDGKPKYGIPALVRNLAIRWEEKASTSTSLQKAEYEDLVQRLEAIVARGGSILCRRTCTHTDTCARARRCTDW